MWLYAVTNNGDSTQWWRGSVSLMNHKHFGSLTTIDMDDVDNILKDDDRYDSIAQETCCPLGKTTVWVGLRLHPAPIEPGTCRWWTNTETK